MSRRITSQIAALSMGVLFLSSASGCFYIPTWRFPDPPLCQSAEDAWGCAVDYIGHQSPVEQPWCDPHYVQQGVYRVAAPYGPIGTADVLGDGWCPPVDGEISESTGSYPELGDMKPPMPESKGPMLPMPE